MNNLSEKFGCMVFGDSAMQKRLPKNTYYTLKRTMNVILNTIVAEELSGFADILEKTDDFTGTLQKLVKEAYIEHKRIIFNGDNYSPQWKKRPKSADS